MKKHYLKFIAPTLLAVSLSACGQSESDNDTKDQQASTSAEQANTSTQTSGEQGASEVTFANDIERQSYAIATTVGSQLKEQFGASDTPVDFNIFKQGLNDILDGKTPALNEQEVEEQLNAFQERMIAEQEERMAQAKEQSESFLEENKSKEGVTVTESGLQYEVLESGDESGATPEATDVVKVHYVGKLVDGTEFDSSYSRNQPAEFPLNGVIPGWTEALQLMRPGDKWRVTIPSDLAYGEAGAGRTIPPNSTLIFDIELLEIVDTGEEADAQPADAAE